MRRNERGWVGCEWTRGKCEVYKINKPKTICIFINQLFVIKLDNRTVISYLTLIYA